MAPQAGTDALSRIAKAALLALAAWLAGCASTSEYFQEGGAPPPPLPRALAEWPYRELWTGVVFNGAKIGFSRLSVSPAPDAPQRWDIDSEAAIRLHFLGVDKRVNLRSRDRVRPDLTLERFDYSYDLDGSPLAVSGESDGHTLHLHVRASGSSDDRKVALDRPLYPQIALALLPVMQGLAPGRSSRFLVLQGETQEVAEARQSIVGYERSTLFEGPAFKIETRLLGMDTTTWLAPDGRPLFELGLHGTMISALETEAQAKRYLVAASLNKDEALVEFSLLRAGPLEAPRRISRLEIEIDGVPQELPVPSDALQTCTHVAQRLRCTVDRAPAQPAVQVGRLQDFLLPTLPVPSTDGQIVALARSIAGDATDSGERIRRLLAWMDANISREAVDSFTAVDVLRERRAECQGHAYLFAALARALGMPVRVVNGLVYSEQHAGFLYHTWNEVWMDGRGWRPVDPTFGQATADATHLKLIEGESLLQLVPLVGMVGKARVEAVRALARW